MRLYILMFGPGDTSVCKTHLKLQTCVFSNRRRTVLIQVRRTVSEEFFPQMNPHLDHPVKKIIVYFICEMQQKGDGWNRKFSFMCCHTSFSPPLFPPSRLVFSPRLLTFPWFFSPRVYYFVTLAIILFFFVSLFVVLRLQFRRRFGHFGFRVSVAHDVCLKSVSALGLHGMKLEYIVQSSRCSLRRTWGLLKKMCVCVLFSGGGWWRRFNYQMQCVIPFMLGERPMVSPWRKLPDCFFSPTFNCSQQTWNNFGHQLMHFNVGLMGTSAALDEQFARFVLELIIVKSFPSVCCS